ncbi:hypothetical protein ZHAS_00009991 [Anopheles sinensis]|uniref:Uncharacterized protein n=1 Tax=Anopheles sinensis TaxID=74873 RepID=A0A084VWG2_ANOSI|nr:hypothetical protein ZHAS_00009991 [Anopheles sinensis]
MPIQCRPPVTSSAGAKLEPKSKPGVPPKASEQVKTKRLLSVINLALIYDLSEAGPSHAERRQKRTSRRNKDTPLLEGNGAYAIRPKHWPLQVGAVWCSCIEVVVTCIGLPYHDSWSSTRPHNLHADKNLVQNRARTLKQPTFTRSGRILFGLYIQSFLPLGHGSHRLGWKG